MPVVAAAPADVQPLRRVQVQAVPGAGIALGGVITAVSGPRAALALAATGAALVTALAWPLLRPPKPSEALA